MLNHEILHPAGTEEETTEKNNFEQFIKEIEGAKASDVSFDQYDVDYDTFGTHVGFIGDYDKNVKKVFEQKLNEERFINRIRTKAEEENIEEYKKYKDNYLYMIIHFVRKIIGDKIREKEKNNDVRAVIYYKSYSLLAIQTIKEMLTDYKKSVVGKSFEQRASLELLEEIEQGKISPINIIENT
ncbi:hypothetical protein KAJ41_00175 [Candidatus Parcubacteria bacterium]|nr:hypothetical protein [Candidatus Parcubacteria bacterium]